MTKRMTRVLSIVALLAAMSAPAFANYNVSIKDAAAGRKLYVSYPVGNGYNNTKAFVAGNMEILVPGVGTMSFNDITGAPCSSWAVAVTYAGKVYTYYYEGAGNLTVNLDAAGKLTLTTTNGKVVPKPAGQCS